MIRTCLNLCLSILTAGSIYTAQTVQGLPFHDSTPLTDNPLSGSCSIVIQSYDWGASVAQAILALDTPLFYVSPEQFQVTEQTLLQKGSTQPSRIVQTKRTVTDAYLSDPSGCPVSAPSRYIALELEVTADVGSPLSYQSDVFHYILEDTYQLTITLSEDSTLTGEGSTYTALDIPSTPTAWHLTAIDGFTEGTHTTPRHTLSYSSYSPVADGSKKPLVIWLHGLGEGGRDPLIPLLGCEATVFAQREFQQLANGAYVLLPQCPTFWLDDGAGQTTQTGESCYTETVMDLIRRFLSEHPDIDQSRIYVGGCSNGGYMTIELLLRYPNFFAAAFPVCQAYEDRWISHEELQTLLDIPIWFVHSELDTICPPDQSTFPTVDRLRAAGGKNFLLTRMTEVYGDPPPGTNTPEPQQYNPHFTWIPVLNGDIQDSTSGQSLFQWLLQQRLPIDEE